jgi:anaerobic magnesium-protoporphyrin IX monomethyl ester cyclase
MDKSADRQKNRMKILLINPPHSSIGSRLPNEHLPPLGLLSIGGPLIDAGHEVTLLDADFHNHTIETIVDQVIDFNPDSILMGHSGSTSAQPVINDIAISVHHRNPNISVIIGGVFPTYHWEEILKKNPSIDFVVCGEGEKIIVDLITAINQNQSLENVKGIAYWADGIIRKNPPADLITNLDDYRVGWELMGNINYTYWGKKKAVVIQFSRGCPHLCNYCGQRLFWQKWRNRNPQLLADEIEMLHEKYGIEVINFADENPASNQTEWRSFLNAIIQKNLNIILVGSIRADNIVRDADHLYLYKKAGFERFLLGIENYDETILSKIKKGSSTTKDMEAIQLLRKHDILSMATYVVGFGEEKTRDFYNSLKQLLLYDPDQIQLLYVTPHKWTPYFDEIKDKKIIQFDQTKWDYKHQILETGNLKTWKVILFVKLIELIMQTRPKALYRRFFHRDKKLRKAMSWYNKIGKKVWVYEWFEYVFKYKRPKFPIKISNFWT